MRFLVDENIPAATVETLRKAGFDIVWVAEASPGIDDRQVLDQAKSDQRILITFDKDFAELVFREATPDITGVILLRIRPRSPQSVTDTVKALLEGDRQWEGHFSVVNETRIRMVPLPKP